MLRQWQVAKVCESAPDPARDREAVVVPLG